MELGGWPDATASATVLSADEAVGFEPGFGNLVGVFPMEVDVAVELPELFAGQGARDRPGDLRQVGVVVVDGLADGERGVVDGEEPLVVVQNLQVGRLEVPVGGADLP